MPRRGGEKEERRKGRKEEGTKELARAAGGKATGALVVQCGQEEEAGGGINSELREVAEWSVLCVYGL